MWQRSILFSGKTVRDPLFRHHRSSQLSGSTKPKRFSASNHFVRTRARFTHKRVVQVPTPRHICTIPLSGSTCLNDPLDQDQKKKRRVPRAFGIFVRFDWVAHARPSLFFRPLIVRGLSRRLLICSLTKRQNKNRLFFVHTFRAAPSKTFQKFHEPADQMPKTFCQKTVAEKCYNFVPSHRTKTLSVKKLLGKRRHTRDRLPVAYWLKKRANKRHEGTMYPR